MESKEISLLIEAFVGYREMLVPIQSDLNEFASTYSMLRSDIEKLSNSFSNDAKAKLDEIYRSPAAQAQKSEELTRKVDQFLKSSTKYTEEVDKLIGTFENINKRISGINEIENKAQAQIEKLKQLEDKKLPEDIDYSKVSGLRLEAVEKLQKIQPQNIGQASRISGVSPADISVLLIHLSKSH